MECFLCPPRRCLCRESETSAFRRRREIRFDIRFERIKSRCSLLSRRRAKTCSGFLHVNKCNSALTGFVTVPLKTSFWRQLTCNDATFFFTLSSFILKECLSSRKCTTSPSLVFDRRSESGPRLISYNRQVIIVTVIIIEVITSNCKACIDETRSEASRSEAIRQNAVAERDRRREQERETRRMHNNVLKRLSNM